MAYEQYCYPNTNILRNSLGIEDEEALRATEARIASLALFALEDEPLYGPIVEERLKATHRAILGELMIGQAPTAKTSAR